MKPEMIMNNNVFKYFGISQQMIDSIKSTATKVHEDVNQYYDGQSYSFHLNIVARVAIYYAWFMDVPKEDAVAIYFAGWFHDSIEDARLTYNDVMKIAKGILPEKQAKLATEIVYALTNEKGRTRAERANWKYYMGIRRTPYARLVKLADRYANITYSKSSGSSMNKKYQKEWKHFKHSLFDYPFMGVAYKCPKELINNIENTIGV